jgi:hypothetical protein
MRSSVLNVYGPLPITSGIWLNASVLAIRSGITAIEYWPSAVGSRPNFDFSRIRMVLSSGADISSVRAASAWPSASRLLARATEATMSRASTGLPSWNFSPSRSLPSQVRPSAESVAPDSICGCGLPPLSRPYGVSNTASEMLRVMSAVVHTGSSEAGSACGTKRSTFAPCARTAGAASGVAIAAVPASAVFRMSRRRMFFVSLWRMGLGTQPGRRFPSILNPASETNNCLHVCLAAPRRTPIIVDNGKGKRR